MRATRVELVGLCSADDDGAFPCYVKDEDWNGFAIPHFTFEVVQEIADLISESVETGGDWAEYLWHDGKAWRMVDAVSQGPFDTLPVVQADDRLAYRFDQGWCFTEMEG